jgi:hypothetical protein
MQRVMEDAVVTEVVNSGMQYAVIAGLRTETGSERFVIAYPNEESLRDLIAAPSIIATGFSSREEAAADSRVPPAGRERWLEGIATRGTARRHREHGFDEPRLNRSSVLRRLARFIVTSYGELATTAIVIFSSRNAVSAVLRMAMGSSL